MDEERQNAAADDHAAIASSEAIVVLTWSACGHLGGLRRLLGAKDEVPHPHALVSLASGAIENAALATWLADSEISGDERNRRFASYQRHGLKEHAKLGVETGSLPQVAVRSGGHCSKPWLEAHAALEDVVGRARLRG